MLLVANASAGLPPLPPGYDINVRMGMPIQTEHWRTVGIVTLNDVRVGMPKIAAFNLTSNLLPPPANLVGNNHQCVLALIHHPDDPYTSTITDTDANSLAERKAAQKNSWHGADFPSYYRPGKIQRQWSSPSVSIMESWKQEILTGSAFSLIFLIRAWYDSMPTSANNTSARGINLGLAIGEDFEPLRRWARTYPHDSR